MTATIPETTRRPLLRRLPRLPVSRVAFTAAAAVLLVLAAGTMPAPVAPTRGASRPDVAVSHVVVCDLYVSRAAMVANSELNIPPAQAAFCVKPGAA